jgi:hypothetical protein
MRRPARVPVLFGLVTWATLVGMVARADEPAAKLRLWHVGNSWSVPFPFEQVGGFERPFVLHTHRFNGGTGPNWLDQALETDKKQVLIKGEFDAIYLGFVQLAQPVESLDQMADLAVKHKPDCRIYLQHAWASGGGNGGPKGRRDEDDLALIDAEWATRRKKLEDKTDEINTRLGRRVVFISPLADAVMRMRRMVVAGTLPGVTKQSELFWDTEVEPFRRDDHGASHIAVLAAYCAHAAIYRKSPEGLPVPPGTGYFAGRGDKDGKPPVTEAAHAALQKLAWEVVSAYPHAGVAPAATHRDSGSNRPSN